MRFLQLFGMLACNFSSGGVEISTPVVIAGRNGKYILFVSFHDMAFRLLSNARHKDQSLVTTRSNQALETFEARRKGPVEES